MQIRLLVMGSIMVGATASLLLFNQNSSRVSISIIPTLSSNSSTQTSSKLNKNALVPLLPSLAKPLTSGSKLLLKDSQTQQKSYFKLLPTPTLASAKPQQFIPNTLAKSSLQKPLPIVTPTPSSKLYSKQFVSTGEAELSNKKSPLVFTHRSRPIVPPIDYPVVPIESLATPIPLVETPTPNASLLTPIPLKPSAAPILTTPTNSLATPDIKPSPS